MKKHIHIFGASGSGTTTISQKVCGHTGYSHFDSDSYFWLPTPDPFTVTRGRGDYAALMDRDLNSSPHWVLSGSVTGWYDELVSVFDLIVFVYGPHGHTCGTAQTAGGRAVRRCNPARKQQAPGVR